MLIYVPLLCDSIFSYFFMFLLMDGVLLLGCWVR